MTNRYRPNEADCPVPLTLLSLLLRINEEQAAHHLQQLPEQQRVDLAFFCFARAHMRPLALRIAALCSDEALTRSTGLLGEILLEQSKKGPTKSRTLEGPYKRTVTLARCA
ncbi:hypothetical protein [Aureimonas sp. AU40]|uniref:hypothetical protein n=1 Tax=Aureimonas sp. AU40 TaxID=1637747 RepID=UPI000B009CB3|nr:hypothetical protein [Aureimonas sp. AU40]